MGPEWLLLPAEQEGRRWGVMCHYDLFYYWVRVEGGRVVELACSINENGLRAGYYTPDADYYQAVVAKWGPLENLLPNLSQPGDIKWEDELELI